MKLKINRQIIEIKAGDYFVNNGSCIQISAGDRRKIFYIRVNRTQGWTKEGRSNVIIPKKTWKFIYRFIGDAKWLKVTDTFGGRTERFMITQEWIDKFTERYPMYK